MSIEITKEDFVQLCMDFSRINIEAHMLASRWVKAWPNGEQEFSFISDSLRIDWVNRTIFFMVQDKRIRIVLPNNKGEYAKIQVYKTSFSINYLINDTDFEKEAVDRYTEQFGRINTMKEMLKTLEKTPDVSVYHQLTNDIKNYEYSPFI